MCAECVTYEAIVKSASLFTTPFRSALLSSQRAQDAMTLDLRFINLP